MRHPKEPRRRTPFGLAPMDRRSFLRTSGLAAVSVPLASALLAACGTPNNAGNDGQTLQVARPDDPQVLSGPAEPLADGLKPEAGPLRIYNWNEYLNPRAIGIFEERYGVKVELTTFTTMAEAISTLTSTATDFDVFFPTVDQIGKLARNGLLQPLNHSYLPNRDQVWEVFSGDEPNAPFYDVGAKYSMPYTVYSTGIGWRTDKPEGYDHPGPSEEEVTGLANPWDIMFDTTYESQVHILDDYREAIGMVLQKNGINDVNLDDTATRAANLATAEASLMELQTSMNVKADITEYSDLPEGASLIHQMWSGDAPSLSYYLPKTVEFTDQFRYWAPETEAVVGNDSMSVMASGKNPVLAHHFINFLLDYEPGTTKDPGGGVTNYSWVGYQPPIRDFSIDNYIIGAGPWQPGRIVPKALANSLLTEEFFNAGVQLLELEPTVESQFQSIWEAFQA